MMNPSQQELELRRQASAEAAERAGAPRSADPDIEVYRQVIRAARQPLADQLPADFAERVARLVHADEQIGFLDRWLPMIAAGVLLIAGVFSSAAMLGGAAEEVAAALGSLGLERLPWSMLMPAGLAVGLAGAAEKLISARRG